MVSSFRRLRAWLAIAAFTATFGLGLSASAHFGPDDDAACGQTVVVMGGHSSVQFETPKRVPAPTHCPFCHWQRAVSGASIASAGAAIVQFDDADLLLPPAGRHTRPSVVDERPSRAPPA